jgi:hypothetical protein
MRRASAKYLQGSGSKKGKDFDFGRNAHSHVVHYVDGARKDETFDDDAGYFNGIPPGELQQCKQLS